MSDDAVMSNEPTAHGSPKGFGRRRTLILCLVLVLVVLGAAGVWTAFGGGGARNRTAISDVERAIRRYNVVLADGYRALNMNAMKQVADPLQAEDEYIHMSSLAEGDVRLDSSLRDLKVLTVSVEATSATAETRERWDYKSYSVKTGALVREQSDLVYHLAWDLAKGPNGSWLVTDVRAISSTTTTEPSVLGTTTPSAHGD